MLIDRVLVRKIFCDGTTTFYKRCDGIREQIKKGRYNRYAIGDGRPTLVEYKVYLDYRKYGKYLERGCKVVPAFCPSLIPDYYPIQKEVEECDA